MQHSLHVGGDTQISRITYYVMNIDLSSTQRKKENGLIMYFFDFERSEYSDSIQAVLGRALIVSTRFENLCKSAYRFTLTRDEQIKFSIVKLLPFENLNIEENFITFFKDTFEKWVSLCKSIKDLNLPENYSEILLNAKDARNELIHNVTVDLEGCIETNHLKNPEVTLKAIERLIKIIVKGDFLISSIINQLNKDEVLSYSAQEKYIDDIVSWVVEL